MKKTIKVQVYKTGIESAYLITLIGNYNEGKDKSDIEIRDIEGYFNIRNAMYPYSTDIKLVKADEPNTYHISEDGGKTFTMTLEFCEVYELATDKIIDPELIS